MGKSITLREDSLMAIKNSMVGTNSVSHNSICVNEARPEVDKYELGQESDNPPVGGNYCHVADEGSINESKIPQEFIDRAKELRPDKFSNWAVINLIDINQMPHYFQKKSKAYEFYKWMKMERENKLVIVNLDESINSNKNGLSLNENKYDDLFNKTITDLENFRKQGAEKYGEQNWYAFSWMKKMHPEVEIDPNDVKIYNALLKKYEDASKLWNAEDESETLSQQAEETSYDVISLAIEQYGTTSNLGQAGYILPDGRLLNFGSNGHREEDHRGIEGIYKKNNIPIWSDEYRYNYVVDFMNHGAIRCCVNGGILDMTKEPTKEQYFTIRAFVRKAVDVDIDFTDNKGNTLHSVSYSDAKPQQVIADIMRYYEEGIKPQGNVQYESKKNNKSVIVNESQIKNIIENLDFEVGSSDIDLSSFKKRSELAPIWIDSNTLDSRVRLRLLDIADDFWEFVNLTWVKPSGIILTGSICNFNWSKFSDIDLHLIVDFDEIDDKTEFVRDYLDAKKNEWNSEHSDLTILGFPVELYVQNLGEMPQSGGIYDLEENEWVKKPSMNDIRPIGLDKFSIKKKAADIMTIIDDMYNVLNSTVDSHEIEEIGEDANYLWKKIKGMRKTSLEKNGESGAGNVVYKILRRTEYLDKLWKLRTIIYDRSNSINESTNEMQAWHGTDAVFDKFDLEFLGKGEGSQEYGKGIYVTSKKSTGEHYIEIIRSARMNAKGKEYMQKKWNASDDEKEIAAQDYQKFLDNYDSIYNSLPGQLYKVEIPDDNGSNYFDYAAPMSSDEAKNIFIEFCRKGLIERGKYSDERYNRLVEKVNAAPYWNNIKSGRDFHLALYEEGMFERFSAILESLGYIGTKVPIDYLHGMKYGKDKNNMNYVIFDPNNIRIISRKDALTNKTTRFNESKEVIKEYLEKDNNLPLYKYFKWASTASSCEKARDLAYSCSYYIGEYIRKIYYRYSEFEDLLIDDEFDYEDESLIETFIKMLEENKLCDHFISVMQDIVDYYELPSWCTMYFNRIIKNEWCIHFGSDSENIAREGFTGGTEDIDHLAYTNAGQQKHYAGYDFAFLINDRSVDYNEYGDEAVIFRTSGVEIFHNGDNQNQVIFWGPNVKSFIPIHQDNGDWVVYGQNGQVLVRCGRPSEIAIWATENLPQYRKQIMTGKNGYIPKMSIWDAEANKYKRIPYPIYRNESIQKYITLLKENMINEEWVGDGNSEHNPYKKRWDAERKALKDFVSNYGKLMQSKENGKLYKCYYDKVLSQLIGYNYCICIQWDNIEMKPKSVLYIRALDKFTPNIRQVNFDYRGRDNQVGTMDDFGSTISQQNQYQY